MMIVFLGPPGVGKGTQCRRLAARLQIPHVSTGDLFRKAVQDRSTLGQQVAQRLAAGQLIEDPLVFSLVETRLSQSDCRAGCILDGFPRTLPQAAWLDTWLAQHGRRLDLVVALDAHESELIERLLRRAHEERRADDTLQTVRKRLELYRLQTQPLIDLYGRRGVLAQVDGVGSPDQVAERILNAIAQQTAITPEAGIGQKD